jgi:tRNA G18 (ribose-2'-O)-methylase SpoU
MNDPHSYRQPGSRLPPREQLIMGIHAVREILLHAPERLLRVYSAEPQKEGRKSQLLDLCGKLGIVIVPVSADALTKMTGSDSHQSVAAHVKGRSFLNVLDFLKKIERQERSLALELWISHPQRRVFGGRWNHLVEEPRRRYYTRCRQVQLRGQRAADSHPDF